MQAPQERKTGWIFSAAVWQRGHFRAVAFGERVAVSESRVAQAPQRQRWPHGSSTTEARASGQTEQAPGPEGGPVGRGPKAAN